MIKDFNKRISSYELILTEDCNLRCKYCFDDAFSDRTQCKYNYVMDINMIDDIISFIEKTKDRTKPSKIIFFGGEPLLNWNFIKEFLEKAKDKNYTYSINTNVTLLTDEIIDAFIKYKVFPILSLDGVKEAHDKNRIDKVKKGSWENIMKKLPHILAKFRGAGVYPTGLMVVTNNNLHLMEKSYEFLNSLKIRVNILFNVNTVYTDGEYESIRKQLISLFLIKKLPFYGDLEKRVLNKKFHVKKNYCVTPDSSVTIAPNGKLFFCHQLVPKMSEFSKTSKEFYGDIYNGFYNVDYFNKLKKLTNMDYANETCKKCRAFRWCKKGCLAARRIETGNYDDLLPTLCKIHLLIHDIFLGEKNGL